MSKLISSLVNKNHTCNPVWFMRQAGRYLPEFRKIREKNKNFIDLCLNSNLSSEITLQPIRRFNLDAAIIFSDILITPFALGQQVNFQKGEGPRLSQLDFNDLIKTSVRDSLKKINSVYVAIEKTRVKLSDDKSLICFVGAPWTLITYMMGIKKDGFIDTTFFNQNKKKILAIIHKLDEFLKLHIENQKKAGADVVQVFDSWAGILNDEDLQEFCYQPNKSLVKFCDEIHLPSICFPRGIKNNYKDFVDFVKPTGINIDYDVDPVWAQKNLGEICIQGGMNPSLLLGAEKIVMREVERYLEIFKDNAYIFNLGHGILPNTNPEIVEKIVNKIKSKENGR